VRGVGAATGFGSYPRHSSGLRRRCRNRPDGACASVTSALSWPSAAIPVKAANLKKWKAFIFDPKSARVSSYEFPRNHGRVPFLLSP